MDLLQIQRLREEHQKGLTICEEKISQWEKFKLDYEALKQRLETLPDCLSYDVTVPFGSNAFTMGKLIHTNKIMVLLGDKWFAEVSAKEAAAIANRRIIQCSKMLEDLSKEKEQYENWLNYIGEVADNENLVEIVETYDDEEEKKWREQHAKNVRASRQKLAEGKNNIGEESTASNSEDEYIAKLESLELVESESEQKEESDRSIQECSDDGSQHSEVHNNKQQLRLHINCNNLHKSFSESETGEEIEDCKKTEDLNANAQECTGSGSEKHVRWQDLSKQNIKKITFKHSQSKQKQNSPKTKNQDTCESKEQALIQSPSDIYKHFGSLFQSSPPKSILKVKTSPPSDIIDPFFPTKESIPKDYPVEEKKDSVNVAFTGEVYERTSPIPIPLGNKSSRPTSHFKNSRKNRKR